MNLIIKSIVDYYNKEPPFFPVILYYEEFNSKIFNKITFIENELRKTNAVYRASTFYLEYDEKNKLPSYYQNMFQKLKKVDFDFDSSNKIVIIDSFFPIDIDYNINTPEFSDFIINFCSESSSVNNFNTKLILGMKKNQMRQIPRNTNLRRYRGKEYNLESKSEIETMKNKRELEFDIKLFPTGNLTSLFHNNPLFWFIEKQILDSDVNVSNFNDTLVNLLKNFTSINLTNFTLMLKGVSSKNQIDKESLSDVINSPDSRNINLIKIYNILNTFRYIHKCKEEIEIKIPRDVLTLLIN